MIVHRSPDPSRKRPAMDLPVSRVRELTYAGLFSRLKAFALDLLIILGYVLVLLAIGIGVTLAFGPLEDASPLFTSRLFLNALSFATLILPVTLYFTLQESSARQGTWGKRKVGLRVVNTSGEPLTRTRSLARSAIKFLPWQIAHTCIFGIEGWPFAPAEPPPLVVAGFVLLYAVIGVYIAPALISKKRRTFYDWAAGSCVISLD